MNSARPIYPTSFTIASDNSYFARKWNNGLIEQWKWISAGFTGTYTYGTPLTYKPVMITGFSSTRADRSFDRELCAFNITTTNCSFNNFTPSSLGGQGGWIYILGKY